MGAPPRARRVAGVALLAAATVAAGAPAPAPAHAPVDPRDYEVVVPGLHVPVQVYWEHAEVPRARVRMCRVEWTKYHDVPASVPMFEDLRVAADCDRKDAPGLAEVAALVRGGAAAEDIPVAYDTALGQLEWEYSGSPCAHVAGAAGGLDDISLGCQPSGVIFHQMRCGSTLMSNMIASLPGSLVYSEVGPPDSIIMHNTMTIDQKRHWLRVVVAALARPIRASVAADLARTLGGDGGGDGAALEAAGGGDPSSPRPWSPRFLYLKTFHTTSLYIDMFRNAFPRMPWVYVHREPVAVLMSLLRDSPAAPPPNAAPSVHLTEEHMPFLNNTPCLWRRGNPPQFLADITGSASLFDTSAQPAEDYCAAMLAYITTSALEQAVVSRQEAYHNALQYAADFYAKHPEAKRQSSGGAGSGTAGGDDIEVDIDPTTELPASTAAQGETFAAAMGDLAQSCAVVRDNFLLNPTTDNGEVFGVGLGMFIDYRDLPDAVPLLLDTHLRPAPSLACRKATPSCTVASAAGLTPGSTHTRARGGARAGEGAGAGAVEGESEGDAGAAGTQQPYTLFDAYPTLAGDRSPARLAALRSALCKEETFTLPAPELNVMMAVAQMYSKARATKEQIAALANAPGGIRPFRRAGSGRLRSARPFSNIAADGTFVEDSSKKLAFAWPALKFAAAKYMVSLRVAALRFNVPYNASGAEEGEGSFPATEAVAAAPVAGGAVKEDTASLEHHFLRKASGAVAAAAAAAAASTSTAAAAAADPVGFLWEDHLLALAEADNHSLPLAADTGSSAAVAAPPAARAFPLPLLLQEWDIGILSPPTNEGKYASQINYAFTNATQRRQAEALLAAPAAAVVPFIVSAVPSLEAAVDFWTDDDAVLEQARNSSYPASFHPIVSGFPMNDKEELETRVLDMKLWLKRASSLATEVLAEETDQLPGWWTGATVATHGEDEEEEEDEVEGGDGSHGGVHNATEHGAAPHHHANGGSGSHAARGADFLVLTAASVEEAGATGYAAGRATAAALLADLVAAYQQGGEGALKAAVAANASAVLRAWPPSLVRAHGIPSHQHHVLAPSRSRHKATRLRVAARLPLRAAKVVPTLVTAAANAIVSRGQRQIAAKLPSLAGSPKERAFFFPVLPPKGTPAAAAADCDFLVAGQALPLHLSSQTSLTYLATMRGYMRHLLFPPGEASKLAPGAQLRHDTFGAVPDNLPPGFDGLHPLGPWGSVLSFDLTNASFPAAVEVLTDPGDVLVVPAGWARVSVSLSLSMTCTITPPQVPEGAAAARHLAAAPAAAAGEGADAAKAPAAAAAAPHTGEGPGDGGDVAEEDEEAVAAVAAADKKREAEEQKAAEEQRDAAAAAASEAEAEAAAAAQPLPQLVTAPLAGLPAPAAAALPLDPAAIEALVVLVAAGDVPAVAWAKVRGEPLPPADPLAAAAAGAAVPGAGAPPVVLETNSSLLLDHVPTMDEVLPPESRLRTNTFLRVLAKNRRVAFQAVEPTDPEVTDPFLPAAGGEDPTIVEEEIYDNAVPLEVPLEGEQDHDAGAPAAPAAAGRKGGHAEDADGEGVVEEGEEDQESEESLLKLAQSVVGRHGGSGKSRKVAAVKAAKAAAAAERAAAAKPLPPAPATDAASGPLPPSPESLHAVRRMRTFIAIASVITVGGVLWFLRKRDRERAAAAAAAGSAGSWSGTSNSSSASYVSPTVPRVRAPSDALAGRLQGSEPSSPMGHSSGSHHHLAGSPSAAIASSVQGSSQPTRRLTSKDQ